MDAWFEALVDHLCRVIPESLRAATIRLTQTGWGWHLVLLFDALGQRVSGVVQNIRSEEDMDIFLSESAERIRDRADWLAEALGGQAALFMAVDSEGTRLRFAALTFCLALSAFGVAARPGAETAAAAAFAGLHWLAYAVFVGYAPVSRGIRQRHVVGSLLRAASYLCLAGPWFRRYAEQGIASNVVLQSALLVMLLVHFALYLAAIAFNPRQQLFLRILEGLTGMLPAFAAAAACALFASQLGQGTGAALRALGRAMGACALFAADRLDALTSVGGLTLPLAGLLGFLLQVLGVLLVVGGAWAM